MQPPACRVLTASAPRRCKTPAHLSMPKPYRPHMLSASQVQTVATAAGTLAKLTQPAQCWCQLRTCSPSNNATAAGRGAYRAAHNCAPTSVTLVVGSMHHHAHHESAHQATKPQPRASFPLGGTTLDQGQLACPYPAHHCVAATPSAQLVLTPLAYSSSLGH